ncbi:Phosphate regulon transcriptional regulatory protein PhoB [Planktothrix tepida]|uniref:Response regulator receiver protein n=2 Tax=Planktothrix TaxID=54304 RepID=A0A1J1LJS2_9CYAN|nr:MULTISPECIES: response regulator [Planktothrix]CAD5912148.1 Phosphate regulon transcriptional regulatory protein PhoB [Planktothrix pseudagardhii]CAD5984742.1 Phosphate regulon transcriptional regulatory protein PhoB [Planktothrix tepida]CUR32156.1 Response regulator receiver protein [Planktothrix tepida PCC 9214]
MLNKQILIVDDEPDVRAIAKLGLELGAGWQVITACCGEEALSLAANHQPDAILLDMMMPDMDGRVTLEYLKSNPHTQNIPVILVTAKAQQWERENFSGMEVAAVFAKPFRPLKLAEQISQALNWLN